MPAYQAVVRARDGRKLRKSFSKLDEAVGWRDETRVGVRQRTVVTPTSVTFREYAERWPDGARTGINLTRDLSAYKPSTTRAYAKHIKRIYPMLGRCDSLTSTYRTCKMRRTNSPRLDCPRRACVTHSTRFGRSAPGQARAADCDQPDDWARVEGARTGAVIGSIDPSGSR